MGELTVFTVALPVLRGPDMGIDVFALVERDHRDLDQGLIDITRKAPEHARDILDGLRFGLAAHAGSEADMLGALLEQARLAERLQFLVAQVLAAHTSQQRELEVLARMDACSPAWHARVGTLRDMVRQHDGHEQASLAPAVRACVWPETYAELAGRFATGRLCLLTMAPQPRRMGRWSHL